MSAEPRPPVNVISATPVAPATETPTETSQPKAEPISETVPTAPVVQDTQEDVSTLKKRLQDQQREITRQQMENAQLRKIVTPELQAVLKENANSAEPEGLRALRKQLESSPELFDDPARQLGLMRQISQQETVSILTEWDAKSRFANEAKEIIGESFDQKELENAYWHVRNSYKAEGKDENPYLVAHAYLHPSDVYGIVKEAKKDQARSIAAKASQQAAAQMEKPGPPKQETVTRTAPRKGKEFLQALINSNPEAFPSFNKK